METITVHDTVCSGDVVCCDSWYYVFAFFEVNVIMDYQLRLRVLLRIILYSTRTRKNKHNRIIAHVLFCVTNIISESMKLEQKKE
jgi:hypothetical protein